MALPLAAPFIDMLVVRGGARWLGAYAMILAMGAAAAALAVALTVALFRVLGPKRTRLVAQIVAAVIGAAFVIGLQVAAILSYGTLSRAATCCNPTRVLARLPGVGSVVWWPARAVLGDGLRARRRHGGELHSARRRRSRSSRRASANTPSPRPAPAHAGARARRPSGVPHSLAAARAAPQGMGAAAPRSLARLADADADALSGAAGASCCGAALKPAAAPPICWCRCW